MIEEIWRQYDKDKSGYLDIDECRKFMKAIMYEMGEAEWREDEYVHCFREFDRDGNGVISRPEMKRFIKMVTKKEQRAP